MNIKSKYCKICCSNYNKENSTLLNCHHQIHDSCLLSYIQQEVIYFCNFRLVNLETNLYVLIVIYK